jgi:hypothetical protein
MAWAGKNGPQPLGDSLRQLHVPILSAPRPIPSNLIPSSGPIAILPTDTVLAISCLDYLKKGLSDVEGIQLQLGKEKVTDETRGIVWMDHSPANITLLEQTLSKHKNIGWIQLPMAGINTYSDLAKRYPNKVWTSAKVSRAMRYAATPPTFFSQKWRADHAFPWVSVGCIFSTCSRACPDISIGATAISAHAYQSVELGKQVCFLLSTTRV